MRRPVPTSAAAASLAEGLELESHPQNLGTPSRDHHEGAAAFREKRPRAFESR